MKLETSRDLLERVRARHHSSWYGLIKLLPASESSVANWKNGRSTVDRKFVTRIAELLDEPAEYVLACVENDRTPEPEVRQMWRRIAERFRSPAIILLAVLGLSTAPRGAGATELDVGSAGELSNQQLIHYAHFRRSLRRRLGKLRAWFLGLKSRIAAPLLPGLWARICSMALEPRS